MSRRPLLQTFLLLTTVLLLLINCWVTINTYPIIAAAGMIMLLYLVLYLHNLENFFQRTEPQMKDYKALQIEVMTLKATRDELAERVVAASWETNPDRSGGAYTQEELNDARRWR